jgi:hypothetical protein
MADLPAWQRVAARLVCRVETPVNARRKRAMDYEEVIRAIADAMARGIVMPVPGWGFCGEPAMLSPPTPYA